MGERKADGISVRVRRKNICYRDSEDISLAFCHCQCANLHCLLNWIAILHKCVSILHYLCVVLVGPSAEMESKRIRRHPIHIFAFVENVDTGFADKQQVRIFMYAIIIMSLWNMYFTFGKFTGFWVTHVWKQISCYGKIKLIKFISGNIIINNLNLRLLAAWQNAGQEFTINIIYIATVQELSA